MIIPTLIVQDMPDAIVFFTEMLDFRLGSVLSEEVPFYAVLTRGSDELHLSLTSRHRPSGHGSVIVVCDDVNALFDSYRDRGLSESNRVDSPVHVAPLDQTWGTREVYIDDPSGNNVILQQR